MSSELESCLVIGVSSRALFDLTAENEVYETNGLQSYREYQLAHENEVLLPGPGFGLIRGLLKLNELTPGKRKSEVIIMSRNGADTSLRIFNSVEHYGLDITRAALSGGKLLAPYLKAFDVDLFLSLDAVDVQNAINNGFAAGTIYENNFTCSEDTQPLEVIRIAFDGDAVLFSDESEQIYQTQGLAAFQAHEKENAKNPLAEGPFAKLLKTIASIQAQFEPDNVPIRTALVTARNSPAHERVVRTLMAWDVRIDEAFFLGGVSKHEVLRAFGAHIFFDDQDMHLDSAAQYIPVAKVPYRVKP